MGYPCGTDQQLHLTSLHPVTQAKIPEQRYPRFLCLSLPLSHVNPASKYAQAFHCLVPNLPLQTSYQCPAPPRFLISFLPEYRVCFHTCLCTRVTIWLIPSLLCLMSFSHSARPSLIPPHSRKCSQVPASKRTVRCPVSFHPVLQNLGWGTEGPWHWQSWRSWHVTVWS